MSRGIQIDPPIVITTKAGPPLELSTVEQVIDYVRRYGGEGGWEKLSDAAFVAAALQSPDSIEKLRQLAAETLTTMA